MTARKHIRWQLGLVCLLVLACTTAAHAADGDLDRSFGKGGRQITDLGALDQAAAIALAPGGKIVVAGTRLMPAKPSRDFAVARYNRNGSLDRSFSGDGIQTTDLVENDLAYGVAIQRDGRIVVVGESWEVGTVLARYHTNGSLDPSFGTGGIQTAGFGPARDVAIQPDGKIVTAGGSGDFAVARFNADGSPDAGFSAGGLLGTGVAATGSGATSVTLAPGGRIVAAGAATAAAGRGGLDIALARYKGDGGLDASFSADGTLTAGHAGVDDYPNDLTVQRDGKLIAAGQVGLDGFGLFRFNRDGSPDTTFGGDGLRTANVSAGSDAARGVALQPGGKIVVAGAGDGFTLARLRSSGSLDTSFSKDGKQTTTMSRGYDLATGIAVQPDCKIVVAGEADGDFALARYRSACPPGAAQGGLDARARLFGSRSQKLGRFVSVSASCREDPCRVTASGSFRVPQAAPDAATAYALTTVRRTITRKGTRARIALRLGKGARTAISRSLRRGQRVTVKLRVNFRQPDAKTATLRRNVRLKL